MLTSFLTLLFLSLLPSCTPLRFVGHCTYDGTSFAGWQIQPLIGTKRPSLRPTIQGSLTTAITNRFNLPDGFYIIGAGRTDAGVHAFNQTFHFDLPDLNGITLATHCHCLNRMLPPPIRILSLQPAPTPDFHSITDSRGKHYSYRFSTAATQSPFSRHTETHIYYPISIPLLCQALAMFVGTNDFRAFAGQILRKEKATGEAVSTVRTVYSIDLTHTGNDCYVIDVRLKGALYKMVRNIVGVSMDVARGKITMEDLKNLLESEATRCDNKSRPAPANGLTLESVNYVSVPVPEMSPLRYSGRAKFFEVDIPTPVEAKRALVVAGGWDVPEQLPLNLEALNAPGGAGLIERLEKGCGFDKELPTLFVFEAVFFYCSPGACKGALVEGVLGGEHKGGVRVVLTDSLVKLGVAPRGPNQEANKAALKQRLMKDKELLRHETIWDGAVHYMDAKL